MKEHITKCFVVIFILLFCTSLVFSAKNNSNNTVASGENIFMYSVNIDDISDNIMKKDVAMFIEKNIQDYSISNDKILCKTLDAKVKLKRFLTFCKYNDSTGIDYFLIKYRGKDGKIDRVIDFFSDENVDNRISKSLFDKEIIDNSDYPIKLTDKNIVNEELCNKYKIENNLEKYFISFSKDDSFYGLNRDEWGELNNSPSFIAYLLDIGYYVFEDSESGTLCIKN